MSKRQRNFTPTVGDEEFDKMIDCLKDYCGINKTSELITYLVTSAFYWAKDK